MKKILPFSQPMINHIPADAVRLSILEANNDYLPIVHNFCNIYAFEVLSNDNKKILDTQFFWNINEIERKLIPRTLINNILSFIQEAIHNNFYVNVCIDSCKLPAYARYNERAFFPHQMAIYGYDTEKAVFYCADFFTQNGFQATIIPFDHFVKAYESMQQEIHVLDPLTGATDWVVDIELLKPLLHYQQSLNIDLIYSSIEHFINGLNLRGYSSYTRTRPHVMTKKHASEKNWLYEANVLSEVYGINVFSLIQRYIVLSDKDDSYTLNIKMCYLFFAYHRLMLFRLSYLSKQNGSFALKYRQLSDQYDKLVTDSHLIMNLFLKYKITTQPELKPHLEKRIENNIMLTLSLLNDLLRC